MILKPIKIQNNYSVRLLLHVPVINLPYSNKYMYSYKNRRANYLFALIQKWFRKKEGETVGRS